MTCPSGGRTEVFTSPRCFCEKASSWRSMALKASRMAANTSSALLSATSSEPGTVTSTRTRYGPPSWWWLAVGGGRLPRVGGPLPRVGGSLPQVGGPLPRVGGSFPRVGGRLPRAGGPLPRAGGPRPRVGEPLPRAGGCLPRVGGASIRWGKASPLSGEAFPRSGRALPFGSGRPPGPGEGRPRMKKRPRNPGALRASFDLLPWISGRDHFRESRRSFRRRRLRRHGANLCRLASSFNWGGFAVILRACSPT